MKSIHPFCYRERRLLSYYVPGSTAKKQITHFSSLITGKRKKKSTEKQNGVYLKFSQTKLLNG